MYYVVACRRIDILVYRTALYSLHSLQHDLITSLVSSPDESFDCGLAATVVASSSRVIELAGGMPAGCERSPRVSVFTSA